MTGYTSVKKIYVCGYTQKENLRKTLKNKEIYCTHSLSPTNTNKNVLSKEELFCLKHDF